MKIFESQDLIIVETDNIVQIEFNKAKKSKSFSDFLKKYPEFIGSAISVGVDAITAYKTIKNQTARFFAKTQMERKMYGDISDILDKSGKFKLVTKKYMNGHMLYELVRK